MTHDLHPLLDSRSLAVIGASDRPGSPGEKVLRYLRTSGYQGTVRPINPRYRELAGLPCGDHISEYRDEHIDHALLLVPAGSVLQAIDDCGAAGVRTVSVYAGGFDAAGTGGDELAAAARGHGMRMLGPNCLGLVNAHDGLVASSANSWMGIPLRAGPVSVLSQSGALGTYLVGLLADAGLGLRYFVSTGNEADVGLGELLEHVAADPHTQVALVYLEGTRDPEGLVRGLRAAYESGTTVVTVKAGATAVGASAVQAHTAALAGDDDVYDAVLRASGAHRVVGLRDAVDAVQVALHVGADEHPPQRAAVISTSGGLGIMAAEALEREGFALPPMPPAVQAAVRELLPHATPQNPIDGSADMARQPDAFAQVLDRCLGSGEVDAALVSISSLGRAAELLDPLADRLREVAARQRLPLVVHGVMPDEERTAFVDAGILSHPDPAGAAQLLGIRRRLAARRMAVRTFTLDRPGPDPSASGAARPLMDDEAMALLADAGVPFARWRRVATWEPVTTESVGDLRFPLAAKLLRPGILHKADHGLVRLGLEDLEAVETARRELGGSPDAAAGGDADRLLLQEMATLGDLELLLGVRRDPTFGRIAVIALGGVLTELHRRRMILLPPFTDGAVREALTELDEHGLLGGFRGRPPTDVDAVVAAVLALADATDRDDLIEAEVNPLLVGPVGAGAIAVDAVVRLRVPGTG
jgi:acetate---CoA ligase (ADP-forming)